MNSADMMSSMMGTSANLWEEILPGKDGAPINEMLTKQYDVIYGSWPNSYDEIVLVVDENTEKKLADKVRQAKKDGLVDNFIYGSVSSTYLSAVIDAL